MNTEIRDEAESVADLLFEMRSKGVRVWSQDGQLRYQARKGALSGEEAEKLHRYKSDIVSFLQRGTSSGAREFRLAPRQVYSPVRATPNQQWRLRTLYPHYSARPVQPIHLSGLLDVGLLRQAFADLAQRHESLRTNFIEVGGEIWQSVRPEAGPIFSIVDLTQASPTNRIHEANIFIDQLGRERIDLTASTEPLFSATLLKLEDTEHILLIHCFDCITDASSGSILWRDLWTLYFQSTSKIPASLPSISIQHADFADWVHKSDPSWLEKHAGYWSDRLAGASRIRLFPEEKRRPSSPNCMKVLPFQLGRDVTTGLRAIGQRYQTSLGMVVFAAWAGMMLRWCKSTDIAVAFLTSGRMHPEIANTIGCFMSPIYLRIDVDAKSRFIDLLPRIGREYGVATEHHDFGRLLTQDSSVPSIGNPLLNWLPREVFPDSTAVFQRIGSEASNSELKILPFEFQATPRSDVKWDFEPSLALIETSDEIVGRIHYRADLFSRPSMGRLAENVKRFATCLQRDPTVTLESLSCV